jgi:hypothetical protein
MDRLRFNSTANKFVTSDRDFEIRLQQLEDIGKQFNASGGVMIPFNA